MRSIIVALFFALTLLYIAQQLTLPNAQSVAINPSATQNLDLGQFVNFIALATGFHGPPPTYQWYEGVSSTCTSDALITGAVGGAYTYKPTATGTTYICTSASSGGVTVYSNTVEVVTNPALSTPAAYPSSATYVPGQVINIIVQPSGGTPPYNYQWFNATSGPGTLIPGATSSTFSETAGGAIKTFKYYARVTDSATAPELAISPQSSVVVSNTPPLQTLNCIVTGTMLSFGQCISYMIPLALIGLMLSLALIALAYMIGEILDMGGLKGWYKNELKETAKSALLIVIIISSLVILSSIAASLAGAAAATGTPTDIYTNLGGLYNVVNSSYLTSQRNIASTAYSEMVDLDIGLGAVKGIAISTWIPFPILPPPLPIFGSTQFGSSEPIYVSTILSSKGSPNTSFVNDAIMIIALPVYLIMQVQVDALWSIIEIGMLIFIPVGILLRALPLMRALGGALVAIGIGIGLIYPAVLVGFNMPVSSYFQAVSPPAGSGCSIPGFGGILGGVVSIACGYLGGIVGLGSGFASVGSVYYAINLVLAYEFDLIIQFLLFVIDIIIIITLVSNIAKMLGGSLRLGIGNIKLI